MIVVLHTLNLEPITVVDLPMEAYKVLSTTGHIRLEVNGDKARSISVYRKEVIFKGIDTAYIFIADNEELALTLTPAFLTGQVYAIQRLCA